MKKRTIIDSRLLNITIERLCRQLIEAHNNFDNAVILSIQPRGSFLGERIAGKLKQILGREIPLGKIDVTFFRDDFRRQENPLLPNATQVPFLIEDKDVILVDDVLYTGRTVRAAMDAMNAFGRPSKVELLVLIDRKYSRHLPINADYTGRHVSCLESEKVIVNLKEQDEKGDSVSLITKSKE